MAYCHSHVPLDLIVITLIPEHPDSIVLLVGTEWHLQSASGSFHTEGKIADETAAATREVSSAPGRYSYTRLFWVGFCRYF